MPTRTGCSSRYATSAHSSEETAKPHRPRHVRCVCGVCAVRAFDALPSHVGSQAMLQTSSHVERLQIMDRVLGKEAKRLAARSTLQSLFKQ